MFEDKALVELDDGCRTVQLWIVDEPGPNNTWNQHGLSGPKIGGTGAGDAVLGGKLGWTKILQGGALHCQLNRMPYPGACRSGDRGEGLWDGATSILDRGVIEWRVLRVL